VLLLKGENMALLRMDINLNLTVMVGILETYEPTDEIRELYNKVQELKDKTKEKIKEILGLFENQNEALKTLKKDPLKLSKWMNYLKNEYGPQLKILKEQMDAINSKICPNFNEMTNRTPAVEVKNSEEKTENNPTEVELSEESKESGG
jgi:seryl-tRNA synthetase